MFNEIRMFQAQPLRVWSAVQSGRYAIAPNGLMRLYSHAELAAMPVVAAHPEAFPVQDQGSRM